MLSNLLVSSCGILKGSRVEDGLGICSYDSSIIYTDIVSGWVRMSELRKRPRTLIKVIRKVVDLMEPIRTQGKLSLQNDTEYFMLYKKKRHYNILL